MEVPSPVPAKSQFAVSKRKRCGSAAFALPSSVCGMLADMPEAMKIGGVCGEE